MNRVVDLNGRRSGQEIDVASGGPQGIRSTGNESAVVLARHVSEADEVRTPVDLVVMPENIANVTYSAPTETGEVETTVDEATLRRQTEADALPRVGRNDPCPCGSGKKYKHCHGKLA